MRSYRSSLELRFDPTLADGRHEVDQDVRQRRTLNQSSLEDGLVEAIMNGLGAAGMRFNVQVHEVGL